MPLPAKLLTRSRISRPTRRLPWASSCSACTGSRARRPPTLRTPALVEGEKVEALQETTTAPQQPYAAIISRHAQELGVPEALAHAVVQVESNYRANARGQAGEIGLMQIKPATARGIGFSGSTQALFDPETNIRYGMEVSGAGAAAGRRRSVRHDPALQCGPRRQAHEPHLVQLLQPRAADHGRRLIH